MIKWDPRRHVWAQVSDLVEQRIADGTYGPHRRLTEFGLSVELGVARGTIRRALTDLRERGVIVTLAGKGSFPAGPLPADQDDDEGESEDEA